jgi:hypothetical protein
MRYSARRLATALLCLFSALALHGCTTDSPTAPTVDVAGAYTLLSVAGTQPPLLFYEDGELVVELLDGSVELAADGTFIERLTFRETRAGAAEGELVELETTGTYTVTGTTVFFASVDSGSWSANATGSSISYIIFDVPFTFGT